MGNLIHCKNLQHLAQVSAELQRQGIEFNADTDGLIIALTGH